jgi:predicted Fe-Mo cluster-binding NifX family protein
MKIIIPVTENSQGKRIIANGFHNTNYVCIYDSTEKNYQWFDKKEISNNEGNLSLQIKLKGISTIITNEIELMTLSLFTDVGLKVYQSKAGSIEENIKLFESNQLTPFTLNKAIGVINCNCKGSHDVSFN